MPNPRYGYLVNLMNNIADMDELSDVTLVAAEDKRKFTVHRLVLEASSDYFEDLLDSRGRNKRNFVLKNIDGPMLETIVHYIYHGVITIDEQNIDAIIDAATSMHLSELVQRCVDFKLENLNTFNCVDTLLIADKYQLIPVKSKAFDMICADYDKIPNEQIAEIDGTNYRKLLESDQLSAAESVIFTGLVNWLSANNVEESDVVGGFLKLIRLRHIQTQFLVDTVEPFLVKHNRKEMISDKYRYRALHPNTEICSRRSRHIYRLVCDSPFLIVNTRFDQSTDEWVEFRRIDFQKRHDCRGIVAGNKLYVMDDKMRAYDLDDFSRTDLPNMNTIRSQSTLVASGKFIHAFGGKHSNMEKCDERFDIENQEWTTRNDMPFRAMSTCMTAIEHNGLIHVASAHPTRLYCYNPVDDTWQLKTTLAGSVIFAKTSSSLYVIENELMPSGPFSIELGYVLHRYDPMVGALTKVGHFNFDESIARTVELNDEIYLMGYDMAFGKLDLRENVRIVMLKSTHFMSTLCLYVR